MLPVPDNNFFHSVVLVLVFTIEYVYRSCKHFHNNFAAIFTYLQVCVWFYGTVQMGKSKAGAQANSKRQNHFSTQF